MTNEIHQTLTAEEITAAKSSNYFEDNGAWGDRKRGL